MSERVENLGRRVELRQARAQMAAEIGALRESLRRAAPLAEDVERLDGDLILSLALALSQKLEDLAAADKKLDVLNRELG